MFYLHLADSVYITSFNQNIVCLNLIKNEYIIISNKLAEHLLISLENSFYSSEDGIILSNQINLPDGFVESIEHLKNIGILSNVNYKTISNTKLLHDKKFLGASNIDWHISEDFFSKKISFLLIIEAYFLLAMVHITVKLFGFNKLIKVIKNLKSDFKKTKPSRSNIDNLTAALDKACFYFPIGTKCLEWAATFTIMCLHRKWMCNIEIGVQTIPFAAHAWAKMYDEIIADSQDLPNSLSVILSEPF